MPRHSGRKTVKSHLKLGCKQAALNGVNGHGCPAVLTKKALQRRAREEAQMGAVKQAFRPVAKVSLNQFCHQPTVTRIGD